MKSFFFFFSLKREIVIEENGVRLRLNIVDTPGYGDQVNNDRWYYTRKLFGTFFNEIIVGTQSLDTSRTNIRPIYVKSSQHSVSVIFRILACTAAYFSFSLLVTRKESIN